MRTTDQLEDERLRHLSDRLEALEVILAQLKPPAPPERHLELVEAEEGDDG